MHIIQNNETKRNAPLVKEMSARERHENFRFREKKGRENQKNMNQHQQKLIEIPHDVQM